MNTRRRGGRRRNVQGMRRIKPQSAGSPVRQAASGSALTILSMASEKNGLAGLTVTLAALVPYLLRKGGTQVSRP